LQQLILIANQITEIKNLEQLNQLTSLDLSVNKITEIKNLEQLKALTSLGLGGNQITEIKNLEQLKKLTSLKLSGNQITGIKNLEQLNQLTSLDLSYNQITEIKNLEQLKELTSFDIIYNQITEIKNLEQLNQLTSLNLSYNQITEIKNLEQLNQLTSLDLCNNRITAFTPQLFALPSLERLYLDHNPWQNLPLVIANHDVGNGVLPQVKRYWTDMTVSSTQVHQAKLVLVGNGRVGKTSLVRRWLDNAFDPAQPSTHAIQLRQKNLKKLAKKQGLDEVKLNIWDFGGQDIYHTTHRLFMQTQALFVLVWDVATQATPYQSETLANGTKVEYRNHQLAYWLHHTHNLDERNPVLVVQSKAAQDGTQDSPRLTAALKTQYQVEACLAIDASLDDGDDNGMNDFEHHVQKLVGKQIKQSCTALPTTWWQTQQAIEQLQQAGTQSLSLEEFTNLCLVQGVPIESVDTLRAYFHHSGVFFYRESLFQRKIERIILGQQWAIDAVYTLFDRTGMFMEQCGKGFFRGKDLRLSWQDKPQAEQALLLSFMEACEICVDVDCPVDRREFFIPDKPFAERTYLVPQLLPNSAVARQTRLFPQGAQGLYFKFRYAVLHAVIIHQFILRTHFFAQDPEQDIRQNVILLHINGKEVLVEAFPEQNELLVRLSNAQDRFILDQIRNEIEEIQGNLAGIEEWVSIDGKAYVKLANLQANARKSHITADNDTICSVADFRVFLHKDEKARLGKANHRQAATPVLDPIEVALACLNQANFTGYFAAIGEVVPQALQKDFATLQRKFMLEEVKADFADKLQVFAQLVRQS
jgi:GTPase SAR1 family protein